MYLLAINLYELGQFLRILLWIFMPSFVVVLLITTYIQHLRKERAARIFVKNDGLLLSVDPGAGEEFIGGGNETLVASQSLEPGQPDEDNLYKGLLWMKQKFEDYREHTDQRISALKEQLEQRTGVAQTLNEELVQAREKIAELTGKLESNMSLLMNIHRELDRSLNVEGAAPAVTPEAAAD